MGDREIDVDRIFDLMGAICDETASQEDILSFDSTVLADESLRRDYWDFCRMHITFGMESRVQRVLQTVHDREATDSLALTPWESDAFKAAIPPTVVSNPPAPSFPAAAWHGMVGYLSSGWPLAYFIATVLFAIGAVIGSHIYVSHPVQVATVSPLPLAGEGPGVRADSNRVTSSVGQITGMMECKWADSRNAPVTKVVCMDQTYALESGLMEITYDTGAKVILQGPVTYKVDSADGGFLSLGKLTARVEKKATSLPSPAGRGAGGEGGEKVARNSSPQPLAPSPSTNPQSPIPNPLFAVRTPTATITDLGTEFGIEVNKSGETTSHVFRGSVRVQTTGKGGETSDDGRILRENESVRVEGRGENREIVTLDTFTPSAFIREIPKKTVQTVKSLDLVDAVAGGDGFSGKRGRGISPATGEPVGNAQAEQRDREPYYRLFGDHTYHRVEAYPFIDGVFIPDGSQGSVQLDSAGHTFSDFSATRNSVTTNVWAGGPVVAGTDLQSICTELGGVEYASPGRGLIFLAANSGVTFDLDAIRRANPGLKLLRFRAVAGNTETESLKGKPKNAVGADIRVFVDGVAKFQRRDMNYYSGAQPVNIVLNDRDRFLTLVATDGGNSTWKDWTMFGDPRLEFNTTNTSNQVPREFIGD